MLNPTIGEDAGKIWQALNSKGELSTAQVLKETGLVEKNAYMAVGWLAREDKLQFRQSGKQFYVSLK